MIMPQPIVAVALTSHPGSITTGRSQLQAAIARGSAGHAIDAGLDQVLEEGALAGLHKYFDRHAGVG